MNIALDFGVSIHICGFKNSDITAESCNITRILHSTQLNMFEACVKSIFA